MQPKPLTARIEVFRPGTFTPMNGDPITYSASDLQAIADAYDPEIAPAPIVVGHPETDAPAYGWAESFDWDAEEEKLYANLGEIEPQFSGLVKDGRFKKISMAFFRPEQSNNPFPDTWYPKHIGFLGAAAPAVSGLKNAKFSDAEAVTFTAGFSARGIDETATLFRMLRDFFIDRFGLEEADKVLPNWRIEWLDEIAEEERNEKNVLGNPAYSETDPKPEPQKPEKEPAVSKQPDAAFAAREAELAERENKLADREAQAAHTENAAFAESLVEDGKLLPALKDKLVAIMDVLPGHNAVSFSEGAEKITAGAALRELLQSQPQVVSYGELDKPDGPDGRKDDPEAIAAFASTYHKEQHELGNQISISEAVEHVMKGAGK